MFAALTPMFFASNYFYAYQGAVNTAVFDGPTRALNATLEGAGAIVGAVLVSALKQLWPRKVAAAPAGTPAATAASA